MEAGWNCNYDCKSCYRFFECPSPFKEQILAQGRMGQIRDNLSEIEIILIIMGGKGGVGKSTVSSQLAMTLARQGYDVGIVDSDFHGPSIPKLLGIKEDEKLVTCGKRILPVEGPYGIKVVSTHFLLETRESLSWFDGSKREALEGFLADIRYGKLDFLLVDLPPGTGSESVNLFKYLPFQKVGALVVTTSSELSQGVAHRCISLCQGISLPIRGLIENMSGFTCPHCGYVTPIFQSGAGKELAQKTGIPYLGNIPLDVKLRKAAEQGASVVASFPAAPSSLSFLKLSSQLAGKKKDVSSLPNSHVQEPAVDRSTMPTVIEMNMERGCYKKRCDDCSNYFTCTYPMKKSHYEVVRHDKIAKRMSTIKHKIAVVSGKGGVGKSTISANLALCLAHQGYRVGIIDSDFHGPCIPKLLGVAGKRLNIAEEGIQPVTGPLGIKVISMGFLLEEGKALTWFHDIKRGTLGDFLSEVDYGVLDWLIIDLPPGTGSENYNILRDLPQLDGVIVVTIPSLLSRQVVERALSLYRQAAVPILGVIVNMTGFICHRCQNVTEIFSEKKGQKVAEELELPWIGDVPLDERLSAACDAGLPYVVQYPDSPVTRKMNEIAGSILNALT
uniref:Iron-sulfur cluster carrier protein n=1 Tax=uncultured Desulfobacterium sp. TaxID=201089 RepID=E1YIX6_9BACT|nr:hypothetical protein N47_K27600 [uncultured Desulfobacterium sp.]